MGARGPKQAPVALRLLTGRHDGVDSGGRVVDLPPPLEMPEDESDLIPPERVVDNPRALAEWRRVSPELVKLKIVRLIDQESFAAYCDAFATYIAAHESWVGEGMPFTALNDKGMQVASQSLRAVIMCRDGFWKAAREFGLTPSSENNIARKPGAGGQSADAFNPFAGTA